MKIVRLAAENFKRIKAVLIEPDGSAVIIGGKNMAGKSSALDAIKAAIGGKKHCPEEPIRRGAKKAEIILDTETLTVRRTFTKKGSQIEVTAKEGSDYDGKAPQTMLDDLIGGLSFDPLEFSRMKPPEQAEIVRKLAGLDFADVDAKRDELYVSRTELGRDLKRETGILASLPEIKDPPSAEVSIADAVRELDRRRRVNEANEHRREALQAKRAGAEMLKTTIEETRTDHIQTLSRRRDDLDDVIRQVQAELEQITKNADGKIARLNAEAETGSAELAELGPMVAKLVDEDMAEAQAVIDGAEEINTKYRQATKREEAAARVRQTNAGYKKLSTEIDNLDERKSQAIRAAKYPIADLQVTDEGVELNGLPFEQASSAEQLRCSVAMGLALNPKLKVLLIKDGSLLDEENLATVAKMAADAEAQVWIERVGAGAECTVVIEDGAVATREERVATLAEESGVAT